MPSIKNWTRISQTPALKYRNRETGARAVLHRAPNSYRYKWRGVILAEGYPVWSQGFSTKEERRLRDELRRRSVPELTCPGCPDNTVVVGEKSAGGAAVQRWFDCCACGYEAPSKIVYGAEQ